jgi:hypothetical protein
MAAKSAEPGVAVSPALFALDHQLLPEAYVNGLLYAHAAGVSRGAYLLGETYTGSRWYYFPVAFAVKTPLATVITLIAGAVLWRPKSLPKPLLVCIAVVMASVLLAPVNIGIRHAFPIYPLMFIAAGAIAARLYARRPKVVRPTLLLLALGLAFESITAFPNYLPFFNAAAGGARGGLHILGDSNLDWGQDLPLLADWQRANPGRTLHLAYFGTADPTYYGIRYRNLPHGYRFGPEQATELPTTGVLAVSASNLQRILATDDVYATFRDREPTAVLGGSIYLFDLGGD